MTSRRHSRREILQGTAALTAAASLGATVGRAAPSQPHAQIDAVLRRAAEAKEVPGVVAVAATDKGTFYEGAFGVRDLANGPEMTPDTIFRLASMTKAITSTAAMQLVEQGKLQLDQPIGNVLPELAAPQVLEGFDTSGAPRLRPAKRPITLRHLLTHTAGFGYEVWNPELIRYVAATGMPTFLTGQLAALHLPLAFDPGERWEYGINIDWVGRANGAKSDRRSPARCHEDGDAGTLERCRFVSGGSLRTRPRLGGQRAAGSQWPQRRDPHLGRASQHLLLDRPAKARHRRDPDPNPAFRGRPRSEALRRVRARRIRCNVKSTGG